MTSSERERPRFAAASSRHPDPAGAVGEIVGEVAGALGGTPSVAVVFASGRHGSALDEVVAAIDSLLAPAVLVGSTSVTVIGGASELEGEDGLSLWAAADLPVVPVRLESLPGSPPILVGLPDVVESSSTLVVLADPATYPLDGLLQVVAETHPGLVVVGGLASSPGDGDEVRLVYGDAVVLDGAVGFLLPPGVATPVVSQGCRPVGSPWVITDVDGPLVRQLGGRPALERFAEMVEGLSPTDRAVAANGLHAGIVAEEHRARFASGDFLVRGLLGADRSSGALAVGDQPELGQVLQFQVRDAASASEELHRLLSGVRGRSALLFTCNGRGSNLFDTPSHDAAAVSAAVGGAVAGMFCSGEVGPVGERNAIHGFTATVLVFG